MTYVCYIYTIYVKLTKMKKQTLILDWPFKRQINKVAKDTQTIHRQFADELFECVWPFCGIGI